MTNVGMASEFIVYYRQKAPNDDFIPKPERGRVVLIPYEEDEETFFLGEVRRGGTLNGVINNISTVPVFQHKSTGDFLLSRTRYCYAFFHPNLTEDTRIGTSESYQSSIRRVKFIRRSRFPLQGLVLPMLSLRTV